MGKILPVLLALVGLGAGLGGGLVLRPDPAMDELLGPCGDEDAGHMVEDGDEQPDETVDSRGVDFVKLNNQFVVPVVKQGSVSALVVMSLSLELVSGGPELVYQREPKLRDAFLQVLFNHANTGGFDGNFTSGRNMDTLRQALREAASSALGSPVSQVLIIDIVRQDA